MLILFVIWEKKVINKTWTVNNQEKNNRQYHDSLFRQALISSNFKFWKENIYMYLYLRILLLKAINFQKIYQQLLLLGIIFQF